MSSKNASLGGRLAVNIVLISLLVGGVASVVGWYSFKQTREEALLTSIESLVAAQAGVLLDPVDSVTANRFVDGLIATPSIVSASVEFMDGGLLVHREQNTAKPSGSQLMRVQRIITLNTPQTSLHLVLWVDKEQIHKLSHASLSQIVIVELLTSLILGVLLFVLVRFRVMRPLDRFFGLLTSHLGSEALVGENLGQGLKIREFDDLVAKINGLLVSIDQEMTQRLSAENQVKQLNDELEQKVEVRTVALEDTNRELQERLDELKKTQKLLLQAQKMAALGHLAAGIAHEINNPVAVVYSNIATMGEYLTELVSMASRYEAAESHIVDASLRDALAFMRREMDLAFIREEAPQLVENSRKSLDRVKSIVNELRTFAHCDPNLKEMVDLKPVMAIAIRDLGLANDSRIRIDTYMEDLPPVPALRSQIRLVFYNLLHNAKDAIEGAGRIEIAGEALSDQVKVVVKDSGIGMTSTEAESAINPFFTRKQNMEGLGLGLTVAYNIMINHGGTLDIQSENGIGTTVTLSFPLTDQV